MICITYFITVLPKVNLKDKKLPNYVKHKRNFNPSHYLF